MRIAIVGCGLIGAKRAASVDGHEIVVVCDRIGAKANALAQKTKARASTDANDAVRSDVDAVVIATTHDQLAGIALAAVEAGKHVLVEKPAGRSVEEVRPIAEAARKHRRIVKVGFNHRFHPGFRQAREIVDRGAIGPLMWIRARYGHGGRLGMEQEWRCDPKLSGGGEAIDQGSHLIDLSRWFLGDVTLDYAAAPTMFWNIGVDDNCFLALRGGRGEMAWLHASWTEWKNSFTFELAGRDGKLTVEGLGGSYGVERLIFHRMLPNMGPPETTSWEYPFPDTSWDAEFADFAAAVKGGHRPCGDIDDAMANLEIIRKIYGNHQ
jgi:predicted dehydrogenase